jgi:hypothetical protein
MAKTLLLILALVLPAMAQRQQWGAYERAVKLPTHPLTLTGSGYDSRDGLPFYDLTQAVRSDGSYAQLGWFPKSPGETHGEFIDNQTGYHVMIDFLTKTYVRKPISRQAAVGAMWAPTDCNDALKVRSPMTGREFKASTCVPGEPDAKYFAIPEGFREVFTFGDWRRIINEAHGKQPDPPERWARQDASLAKAKEAGPFFDESIYRATRPAK